MGKVKRAAKLTDKEKLDVIRECNKWEDALDEIDEAWGTERMHRVTEKVVKRGNELLAFLESKLPKEQSKASSYLHR